MSTNKRNKPPSPIRRAVKLAGGHTSLGDAVGATKQQVCNWCRRGSVSARYAVPVHLATGVPLHRLRPDLYPSPRRKGAGL